MFTHAIVREPSPEMIHGLTTAQLGPPDYEKALAQHRTYTNTLRKYGLEVLTLPADSRDPDATFIEDVALCTPVGAVITRPGAPSRRGETAGMEAVLGAFFKQIARIEAPGTLEGGDIMMVGDHYYVGLSNRTNAEGARQLAEILESWGLSCQTVPLKEFLHLKTGVSYLENNRLLVCGEFKRSRTFKDFDRIEVDETEAYAANSLYINGRVLVPAGFPNTRAQIESIGLETIALDVSEFQKLDGGLSCLSLRLVSKAYRNKEKDG